MRRQRQKATTKATATADPYAMTNLQSNGNEQIQGFFASLRMTTSEGDDGYDQMESPPSCDEVYSEWVHSVFER
jgi:hypothetical protein